MPNSISRRHLLRGSVAAAAVALSQFRPSAFGFAEPAEGETVVPFVHPQPMPEGKLFTHWDELKDWFTPAEQIFSVAHYGKGKVDKEHYQLEIVGSVEKPRSLTLDQIKALPRRDVTLTIECGGNGAGDTFMGAIANCRWAGTPLAPLLKECGIKPEAVEVAFHGADKGKEKIRDKEYIQNFSRSLTLAEAARDDILLGYEMNGQPLDDKHGAPLRLIVPGWYGVAWVKWLMQIEVRERRLMGRFMARDYVTIRGEQRGAETIWRENLVGPMNVKSIVARVVKRPDHSLKITGAAWTDGTQLKAVEVKIDDGPWQPAQLDQSHHNHFAWTFWSLDWREAPAGEHTLVSRAIDSRGRIQPSADDPEIKLKQTYWEANQQYPRKIKV